MQKSCLFRCNLVYSRVQDHIHLSADFGELLYGVKFLWPRHSVWVYWHEKGSVDVLTSWLTWLMFVSCWCDTSTRAGFCETKTSSRRASEQLSSCFFYFFCTPVERADMLMYKSDPSWSSWFWSPIALPYQSSPDSCIVTVLHKLIVLKLIKF